MVQLLIWTYFYKSFYYQWDNKITLLHYSFPNYLYFLNIKIFTVMSNDLNINNFISSFESYRHLENYRDLYENSNSLFSQKNPS